MSTPEEMALAPSPEWVEARSRMLEDTWLLTLFALVLATALPWFVSAFNIDFAAASWAIVLLGVIYVALTLVARIPSQGSLRRRALGALNAAGVIGIGLLWRQVGALQNPAFLLAFALPVFAASALSRWQPYATAALAVVVAAAVALSQSPELRWYAAGLHAAVRWGLQLIAGQSQGTGADILPGFYAPVGYDVVLLEVLTVLLFTCAVAAESLASSFDNVLEHLATAQAEATHGQDMWATLLLQMPLPALLVDADSHQIVLASRALAPFWPTGTHLAGRALFDVIHCAYPERLREALAGTGGVTTAMLLPGAEARLARIRTQPLDYEGRRLALVLLEDVTDTFGVAAALDAEEHGCMVISARGRVMTANKAAHALFPDALPGSDAGQVLSRSQAGPDPWWDPGLTGRRRLYVTIRQHNFLTTCTAVPLPGDEGALCVIAFTPLAPGATAALPGLAARVSR
jgi:PAS domain-containing protein